MYDEESSEGGPKSSFEIYKAEGDVLYKQGEYTKALESYNMALEIRPDESSCLVARSQCYLQLGDSEAALTDAEATLKSNPNNINGLYQKAESLYQKGDFEFSLVFYHRGYKLRPEKQEFRKGIQKAQEAIDNSVGDTANIKLDKKGDLSDFYRPEENKKQKQQKQGYTKPGGKKEKREDKPRKKKSAQDQKTIKQLLGELYDDREYLEGLLGETEEGMESKTNQDIHDLCENTIEYLDKRTDFWRQQKPLYARAKPGKGRDKSGKGKKGVQGGTQYYLDKLEEIDNDQAEGRHNESLKKANKCLKEVEGLSDDDLQNRAEIVANLHSCIGNAYLEKGDYNKALEHHQIDNEIATQNDLEDAKSRSMDNLGRVYARMGKFDKAVEIWEQKLPLSKSPLERTWLYHEIGRCYLEIGKYEDARDYGEKSLAAAEEAKDDVWQLNASVLMAQAEVKLGDLQAALEAFEKSLDMAKVQGDSAAEAAIKRAIEDVNQKIVKGLKEGEGESEQKDKDEDTEKDKTKYAVTVYTADKMFAGTDANVYIEVKGDQADSGKMPLNNPKSKNRDKLFESGSVDEFELACKSLGKIKQVKVSHDGSGSGDGWFLDKIIVQESGKADTKETFNCDRWLDSNEDDGKIERTLEPGEPVSQQKEEKPAEPVSQQKEETTEEPVSQQKETDEEVKYEVTVYTGDEMGSGTDANVCINIVGEDGETGTKPLGTAKKASKDKLFENGSVDEFEISCKSLGKLQKIKIWHDAEGFGAGWFLDKVEIQQDSTKVTFECHKWLDKDEDDGAIERELFPVSDDGYSVNVRTMIEKYNKEGIIRSKKYNQKADSNKAKGSDRTSQHGRTKRASKAGPAQPAKARSEAKGRSSKVMTPPGADASSRAKKPKRETPGDVKQESTTIKGSKTAPGGAHSKMPQGSYSKSQQQGTDGKTPPEGAKTAVSPLSRESEEVEVKVLSGDESGLASSVTSPPGQSDVDKTPGVSHEKVVSDTGEASESSPVKAKSDGNDTTDASPLGVASPPEEPTNLAAAPVDEQESPKDHSPTEKESPKDTSATAKESSKEASSPPGEDSPKDGAQTVIEGAKESKSADAEVESPKGDGALSSDSPATDTDTSSKVPGKETSPEQAGGPAGVDTEKGSATEVVSPASESSDAKASDIGKESIKKDSSDESRAQKEILAAPENVATHETPVAGKVESTEGKSSAET